MCLSAESGRSSFQNIRALMEKDKLTVTQWKATGNRCVTGQMEINVMPLLGGKNLDNVSLVLATNK